MNQQINELTKIYHEAGKLLKTKAEYVRWLAGVKKSIILVRKYLLQKNAVSLKNLESNLALLISYKTKFRNKIQRKK